MHVYLHVVTISTGKTLTGEKVDGVYNEGEEQHQ